MFYTTPNAKIISGSNRIHRRIKNENRNPSQFFIINLNWQRLLEEPLLLIYARRCRRGLSNNARSPDECFSIARLIALSL